ncbi:MAG TPA: lytic transglycosylase [Gammaproteobacteria bacterium]|nr:lytic transglycosylase [Gammaproteobacteria bacterium]
MQIKRTLSIGVLISLPLAAGADIYKYVDNSGRVNLVDNPVTEKYTRIATTRRVRSESAVYGRLAENRVAHSSTINLVAKSHQLPSALIHAVISAESGYDADAVSSAGAVGLMQLMPATAKRYGVGNRRDPHSNVLGGTRYLKDLLEMFDNDLVLALAAYNAGENAIIKYGHQIPPYEETRSYVRRVLKYYNDYKKFM